MILIPFSSGLDSTALVYNALEKKEKFEVCYIEIKNNIGKSKIEFQQRSKILKLFNERFSTNILDSTGTEILVNRNRVVSLPQLPIWIMGLLYNISDNTKEVRLGYCKNDDAISYIDEIKKIWKSYETVISSKLPKLTFPISKNGKIEHSQKLPNDIFQETFFCEDPRDIVIDTSSIPEADITWRDCGECGPCRRSKYDETFDIYSRNRNKVKSESFAEFSTKAIKESFKVEGSGLELVKEKTTKKITKTTKKTK